MILELKELKMRSDNGRNAGENNRPQQNVLHQNVQQKIFLKSLGAHFGRFTAIRSACSRRRLELSPYSSSNAAKITLSMRAVWKNLEVY